MVKLLEVFRAAYCQSFALQVRAPGDAEAEPGSFLLMQENNMDVLQLLEHSKQFINSMIHLEFYLLFKLNLNGSSPWNPSHQGKVTLSLD